MRGLRDGSIERDRRFHSLDSAVALITAEDRVDRIKDRDVNDGHGAAGAGRSQLLAEGAYFAGRDWGVIKSTGVYSDRVPAMNRIERILWRKRGARRLHAVEPRAEEIAKARRIRMRAGKQIKSEEECGR